MKTTIKAILISLTLIFASSISAQNPLTYGVKAGVNLTDFYGDIEDNNIKVGYNAGITVDYKLSRSFYLLSAIEVTTKGTREKGNAPIIGDGSEIPYPMPVRQKGFWNPIYLHVPLHAGYIYEVVEDMAVMFHAGPFVSYGIAGKVTTEIAENKYYAKRKTKTDLFGSDADMKRWDFGMGIGAGFEYKKIGVNFGYDLGILNVSKESDRSLKTNSAQVSLSYRFQ